MDFPDARPFSQWVDFLYGGVPVLREIRVLVDGARAGLPVPYIGTMNVPEKQVHIWELIDNICGAGEFYPYLGRAGLKPVKTSWPYIER